MGCVGTWLKLTSALHEGEEVVQELLAFGIIVDFVQLQGEREKRFVLVKAHCVKVFCI